MIKIKDLSYSYRDNLVIKDLSFDIKENDFIALIGANGSGKTTLVKLLLGILKPSKGKIDFDRDLKFGYVPQKFNIDYNFPVRVDEILNREDETIKMLNIHNLMKKQFSKLSGGQQQKVIIALALLDKPDILIFDEPTTGIDTISLEDFYDILDKLNKSGKTIIIVSHDISVISKKVKTVICLSCEGHEIGKSHDSEKLINASYKRRFNIHNHV